MPVDIFQTLVYFLWNFSGITLNNYFEKGRFCLGRVQGDFLSASICLSTTRWLAYSITNIKNKAWVSTLPVATWPAFSLWKTIFSSLFHKPMKM